jgi:hypothetical protein
MNDKILVSSVEPERTSWAPINPEKMASLTASASYWGDSVATYSGEKFREVKGTGDLDRCFFSRSLQERIEQLLVGLVPHI